MEEVKKCFFNSMINETKRKPLEFVSAMRGMENFVRGCYSDLESVDRNRINSDAFVKMMILDGCFIVQLFLEKYPSSCTCFIELSGITSTICYDLLLLENQLPFAVLLKLYEMIARVDHSKERFARLALNQLAGTMPGSKTPGNWFRNPPKNIKHLLGLVHDGWLPLGYGHQDTGTEYERPEFIRCATELEEAGINFEKLDANLFDVKFEDAKLMIPTLNIWDQTDIIFRNLVAYEQFILPPEPTYVCDYMVFMDNLINSSKDVKLLRRSEVIVNWLGDDEAVAQMFNKLHEFAYSNVSSFYYAQMYREVHKHCRKRRYEWKAKLKKDYFSSPWSIFSVLAAVVLLLLTVQQSIFSVLSYVHQ